MGLTLTEWKSSGGRTPHGVRGLKSLSGLGTVDGAKSHPTRGAWIEISHDRGETEVYQSHPTRGAWIEIGLRPWCPASTGSRTPHGVRGLKWVARVRQLPRPESHPTRGAWIEIFGSPGPR